MGTDSVIYFRTDGNCEIATGHMMRCLSIARACRSAAMTKNIAVCFLVSDAESAAMIQSFLEPGEQISIQILKNADYQDLEKELTALISILSQHTSGGSICPKNSCSAHTASVKQPVLFLDSYFVTPKYLDTLAPYAYIAYLDDLQLFDYPVDLVINYDVLTLETQYVYERKYSLAKKRLLGAAYTPLREQFTKAAGNIIFPASVCNILIASGGSDPCHTCLHLLEFFINCHDELTTACQGRQLAFHILVGSLSSDKEALRALSKDFSHIFLHENITDMASLMSSCHLAFSAAGTTLYELCALGVPTASFILADNQIASAWAFHNTGAVPLLGDVRSDEEAVFSCAKDFMEDMLYSPEKYKKTATHMQQLVDGQGAARIAKELSEQF